MNDTKLSPYQVTAREITGAWPPRARKTRDNPDRTIVVCDGAVLRAALRFDRTPAREAFNHAESARIFLRYTDATVYAVALVTPFDLETGHYRGSTEVYYGQAGGNGYDRTAAALSGIPIGTAIGTAFGFEGTRHPVILTDHCGLHGVDHPWRGSRFESAFLVHEGFDRYLPGDLFAVG